MGSALKVKTLGQNFFVDVIEKGSRCKWTYMLLGKNHNLLNLLCLI